MPCPHHDIKIVQRSNRQSAVAAAAYYGLNALSHNVIMANRKKLKNPNGLFLGVPGSGKSFAAKRELVNVFLATRDRIIVVDPMGEYSPLILWYLLQTFSDLSNENHAFGKRRLL